MSQSQIQSSSPQSQLQQSQKAASETPGSKVLADGMVICVLCLKKHQLSSCKQCTRCSQICCKSCFKIESKNITPTQKKMFNSNSIGRCCFSDLIYQQSILSDSCCSSHHMICSLLTDEMVSKKEPINVIQNTIQWGKDSIASQSWSTNDYKQDFSFINSKLEQDDYFEICLELSNTKYKEHFEMKTIEKEIFEDDIYSRKYMNKSFAEFLSTIQHDIQPDKVKQDQFILLKAFIAHMLDCKQTPEDKIYQRGHGLLALFLLCFCSIKKSFYIMKEIYSLYYVDILHPDQIKKEQNYCSIVKHIVFIYLQNFQKKKDPNASFIEKIVAFTRKYLYYQYNSFFLNQLNFSCAYQIIERLLTIKNHEVMTNAMASIIHLNLKTITEGDTDKINLKDLIYNKVQPENIITMLLQPWEPLKRDAVDKIIEEYYKFCEQEKYKLYDIGAHNLEVAVKDCVRKQKNQFKIMEEHYIKEIKDLKSALKLAMNELRFNAERMHRLEVEKNNVIVQYQSLKKKYEVSEIEYEDIQSKLQFLNERASKRQMHYNKEYEAQIYNLQQQIKNSKLDFKEMEMLYRNQQVSFKSQMDDKDNIIKRLKQGIQLLQRQRNDVVTQQEQQSLQEVGEICKNPQEQTNSDNSDTEEPINQRLFHSFFQPKNMLFKEHTFSKKFDNKQHTLQTTPQIRQTTSSQVSEGGQPEDNNKSEEQAPKESIDNLKQKQKSYDEKICDEIEDERQFYAVNGDGSSKKSNSSNKQQKDNTKQDSKQQNNDANNIKITPDKNRSQVPESSNDKLSQSVLMMYKQQLEDPSSLQKAINEQQTPSPSHSNYSTKSLQFEQSTSEKQFISSLEHPYFYQQQSDYENIMNRSNMNNNFSSPGVYPEIQRFSPTQTQQQQQAQQQFNSSAFKSPSQYNTNQGLTQIHSTNKSASPHSHKQSSNSPKDSESQHNQDVSSSQKPSSTNSLKQQKINSLFGNRLPDNNSPKVNHSQEESSNEQGSAKQPQRQQMQRAMTQTLESNMREEYRYDEDEEDLPTHKRTQSNQSPSTQHQQS